MTTWQTEKHPDETCSKCGAVYEVTSTQYPAREKDSFTCTCGEKLRSWSGTHSYDYTIKTTNADR